MQKLRIRTNSGTVHSRAGHDRSRERDEPFLLAFTMLLIKLALGAMACVLAGVALLNYRILLHSDGQVEFTRKPEWTLADTFHYIQEPEAAPETRPSMEPAPLAPVPPQIASAPTIAPAQFSPAPFVPAPIAPIPPAPVAPAAVAQVPAAPAAVALAAPIAHASPAPHPSAVLARAPVRHASPAPMLAAAPKLRKPVVPDEDEADEDPVAAVLSTARPAPVHRDLPPAEDAGAGECRRIRRALVNAVLKLETDQPRERVTELRVFDLIQGGYLETLESCPSLGGFILQRHGRAAEVRCTVHGS